MASLPRRFRARPSALRTALLGAAASAPLLTGCPLSDDYFIRSAGSESGGSDVLPFAGTSGSAGSANAPGTGGQSGSSGGQAGSSAAAAGSAGSSDGGTLSGGSANGGSPDGEGGGWGRDDCSECNAGRSCDWNCQSGWIATSPPPGGLSPRERAAYVSLGNQLFVWGGLNESGTALNSGAIYDARTDTWRMIADDANTPSPRSDATAVWTGTVVVVFGGLDPSGPTTLSDAAIYDPVDNRWLPAAAGPTARAAAYGAFTLDRVLLWSGVDGAGEPLAGIDFYDPVGDTWTQSADANEPPARYDTSPASGQYVLWTFGGRTAAGAASSLATYYSFTSETWFDRSEGSLLSARWGGFGTLIVGLFYSWGGRDLDSLFADGMHSETTTRWTALASDGAPSPRYSAYRESGWSLTVDDRWLVVVGGLDDPASYLTDGARYDTTDDTWSAIESWPGGASHAFGAVAWVAGEIVVWGGRDGSALTNTGVRYLPSNRGGRNY